MPKAGVGGVGKGRGTEHWGKENPICSGDSKAPGAVLMAWLDYPSYCYSTSSVSMYLAAAATEAMLVGRGGGRDGTERHFGIPVKLVPGAVALL